MDEKMLEVAKNAAQEAGKMLLEGFGQTHDYSYKEDFSQSAQADNDAEKIIIDTIKASFPDHAILAEESGESGNSEYKWVIDPLDGTSNYIRNIALWGVSIALQHGDSLELGVIYLPTRNELFWAQKGKGAFLNDQPLKVSNKSKIKETLTFFESGRDEGARERLESTMVKLFPEMGTFKKWGASAYALALVAKGDAEVMIEVESHFWDSASGIILIEEAGGKVTTFSGEAWKIGEPNLLMTNGAVHEEFLKLLNS